MDDLEGGESVLRGILQPALELEHPQLKLYVERVEEVASEDDRVDRGVDRVDPTRRDEQRLTRL